MSEQEEEKNSLEGSQQIYGKSQKTPTKFGKMHQSNPNTHQYGEIEDRLRKTSSTFSFRDEGIPVVQEDVSYDQSFERNDISVTPCKSPLNLSDNIHYDVSENSIPQGTHNLANSFIKRSLVQNFENISNQYQNQKDQEEIYTQSNGDGQGNDLLNTPQLNGQQSDEIPYPQLNEFNSQVSSNQGKKESLQNDNNYQIYQNRQTNQNGLQQEENQINQIISRSSQNQDNNKKQNNLNGRDIMRSRQSKDHYQEDPQLKPLKVITEGEQEDDQYQELQSGELELQIQKKQESNENDSSNHAIKIVQNQNISINNSNKDLDNHYWESTSAIDAQHPQQSSTSIHSQKDKEFNKGEENREQNDRQRFQPQLPTLQINSKSFQREDLPNFKQSEIKNPRSNQNEFNNNFLHIQQNDDFLFSQQTTPRGETGNHSPQNVVHQRKINNGQQNPVRNGEYHNIYQEFLKKQNIQSIDSPQIQEEAVARFGASDCSSLPEDESIIGENNNHNQNNTFISNNMSTILQQLNNPSSNEGQSSHYHNNQYSSNSQNRTKNGHSSQPNYNQQKQSINEFNFNINNNQNNLTTQFKKFPIEYRGNQQQMGKYFPSELIGSREIATTESYLPTPDQSQLTGGGTNQNKNFEQTFKQRQFLSQNASNIGDQAFVQSSFEYSDQNPQSIRYINNQNPILMGGGMQADNRKNIDPNFQQIFNNNNNNNYKDNFVNNQATQNIQYDQMAPNLNFMQQMFQNFMTMNQTNQSQPPQQQQQQQQQQQYNPILNDLNNSRICNINLSQQQGDNFNQQQQNCNEFNQQQDDYFKNQQLMEFFNQQHAFVMNIMNFYEFHLNKMKQIAIEKTQELMEKDRVIQDLQNNRNQDQNIYSLQTNLQTSYDEIRLLKQKEKRLELLIDQNKDDYEFQIHDLKDQINQVSKSKEQLDQKQKEILLILQKEQEKNMQLQQKIETLEQKQDQISKEKDIMEDNLNEIIGNLKLDIKHKDKKIVDQQTQIDLLQNKLTRMNEEKKEEEYNIKRNNFSGKKGENQLNKSFDDLYYNRIKDDLQNGNSQQQNNYNNYLHYKERGQKSQFGDLLKQNGEQMKNESPLQNMYDKAQKFSNGTPQKSLERIGGNHQRIEASYEQSYIDEDNPSYNNSNQRNSYSTYHQKGKSGDRNSNNLNFGNQNTNNLSSQKQNHYRTPSSGEQGPQFINNNNNNNTSDNYNRQHMRNNNYYEDIYKNYSRNDNEYGGQPFNNYTQSFISNSNISNNSNSNKVNTTNTIPYTYKDYMQASNDKTNKFNNFQIQEDTQFNYRQNQKPTLTFPSNQNYENNHQQIKQIEQALTSLNLEKQQLEAQILKLPIHQKNAQQRLQKHNLEKNLETLEKEINNNRKKLKQIQNY